MDRNSATLVMRRAQKLPSKTGGYTDLSTVPVTLRPGRSNVNSQFDALARPVGASSRRVQGGIAGKGRVAKYVPLSY